MAALVTAADISTIQSLYPWLEIRPLTSQQEQFLMYHLRGMSVAEASRAVGYTSPDTGRRLLAEDRVKVILEYMREREFADVRVSLETLTAMLFEAHRKAATATEEIAAIRELGKLHALYPEIRKGGDVNIQINHNNPTEKQLARMSTEELLRLAEPALAGLLEQPTPIDEGSSEVLDGEWVDESE